MGSQESIAANERRAPLQGTVVVVSIDDKHRFGKPPRVSATLIAGLGVEGDAHFGTFVKHRYLARRNPRSPNLRQVHLLPSELFAELRTDGYDLGPGDLGENITTAGLDLESLPLDTELKIGSTATVRVTGLRTPCVLIDRFKNGLKGHLVCNLSGPPFRAGVMGVVSHGGEVCPGDAIQVDLPTRPRRLLPPL